jgi:hypothetical protein
VALTILEASAVLVEDIVPLCSPVLDIPVGVGVIDVFVDLFQWITG